MGFLDNDFPTDSFSVSQAPFQDLGVDDNDTGKGFFDSVDDSQDSTDNPLQGAIPSFDEVVSNASTFVRPEKQESRFLTRKEAIESLINVGVTEETELSLRSWMNSLMSRRDQERKLRVAEAGYLLNYCVKFDSVKMPIVKNLRVYEVKNGSVDLKDYTTHARECFGMAGDLESVVEISSRRAIALPYMSGMVRLLRVGVSWDGRRLTIFDSLKPCPKDIWDMVLSTAREVQEQEGVSSE